MTARRISAASLQVFDSGQHRCWVNAADAIDGIATGLYKPVGSKRSVTALILLRRPNDEFAGPVPKMKPTSFRETVGDYHVWQHGRNALEWQTT